jgi:acetyl esterase/lipase
LQQIADIKSLVRAARAESNCKDGEVAVVGGSAGGTHAIWIALDTSTTSGWDQSDRPNCAVGLSGGYDLSDQDPSDPLMDETSWIDSVQNYTNTCDRIQQKSYSPVSIVATPTSTVPFRPIFIVNGSDDQMIPGREIFDMDCA